VDTTDSRVINAGGACALIGVAAGFAGGAVAAVYGLGGQEIALRSGSDFQWLVDRQPQYLLREWLFLAYAVFAIGQGVGLYYLTRPARNLARWGLVAFAAGIVIGVLQDAAFVGFVHTFPREYAAADATTRLALEPIARTLDAIAGMQQAVANMLLGVGVALYSSAVLRGGVASKWFGLFGLIAASASVFYGAVTAAAPRLDEWQMLAEQAFGLVVFWDLAAGVIMLGFRPPGANARAPDGPPGGKEP
jgi:hypothetical protein